jgi:hypothetical protein
MIEAETFRTFIRIYSLLKNERLSANIKLPLHKAMIRSIMTNACLTLELAADTYLLKLQRLRNKALHIIGNVSRCTLVRDLQMAFNFSYTII